MLANVDWRKRALGPGDPTTHVPAEDVVVGDEVRRRTSTRLRSPSPHRELPRAAGRTHARRSGRVRPGAFENPIPSTSSASNQRQRPWRMPLASRSNESEAETSGRDALRVRRASRRACGSARRSSAPTFSVFQKCSRRASVQPRDRTHARGRATRSSCLGDRPCASTGAHQMSSCCGNQHAVRLQEPAAGILEHRQVHAVATAARLAGRRRSRRPAPAARPASTIPGRTRSDRPIRCRGASGARPRSPGWARSRTPAAPPNGRRCKAAMPGPSADVHDDAPGCHDPLERRDVRVDAHRVGDHRAVVRDCVLQALSPSRVRNPTRAYRSRDARNELQSGDEPSRRIRRQSSSRSIPT